MEESERILYLVMMVIGRVVSEGWEGTSKCRD